MFSAGKLIAYLLLLDGITSYVHIFRNQFDAQMGQHHNHLVAKYQISALSRFCAIYHV